MPFRFAWICDLLEDLEHIGKITPKLAPRDKQKQSHLILTQWFRTWGPAIRSPEVELAAVLSTLFPERRTDRVYELQANRVLSILSRALGLGNDRLIQLQAWRATKSEDLGSFTAKLVRATDGGLSSPLTIEQIDSQLEQVAARRRFSSPAVRNKKTGSDEKGPHEILGPILRQLPSKELKWFIRLLLKDFAPVVLDETFILRQIHFLLPRLLQFQSTFDAAATLLRDPRFADAAGTHDETGMTRISTPIRQDNLRPAIGTKIGRPTFIKARSLKQCLKIVQSSRWSIEPKYDGEYAQVHIDLTSSSNPIQIFAKSGKDATNDRIKLHDWIRECLRLDAPSCRFKRKCILEGEMIVYDTNKSEVLPFHKIRKHCSRSGSFLGTENDSQAHPHERLMMVFYDCLLVDEEVTMALPYSIRRQRLHQLLHDDGVKKSGKKPLANRSNWAKVDFSKHGHTKCTRLLEKKLAEAIAGRCEGLILKPVDSPYFSLDQSHGDAGKIIKLKKDYIQGLGDSADFAVIGARRDARALGAVNTQWTHFVIATIENKDAVLRFGTKPIFRIADSLTRPCISLPDMAHMAQRGAFGAEQLAEQQWPSYYDLVCSEFDVKPDVAFKKPFIVDILGSGFDKPSSRNHWMLRHPRITKVHGDRGLEDVVSFDELQEMAAEATNAPEDVHADQAAWQRKIETMSKPKRQPLVPRSPTDTTNSASITESIGTNVTDITTPTRTPRPRPHVTVRMDSMEMRPGEQRPVDAEVVSSATAESAPEVNDGTRPAIVRGDNAQANLKTCITAPQKVTHVLQRATPPTAHALQGHLRGGAVRSLHSGTSYLKRSRAIAESKERAPAELKRARTVPESVETLEPLPASLAGDAITARPALVRATTHPSRAKTAPTGNAGESQAVFYDALPQLDGTCDEEPQQTKRLSTTERSSSPPLPTNLPTTYQSVFSAPWSNVRAQLLRSSSPASDPVAVESSSPRRSAYMTPPSTREDPPAAIAAGRLPRTGSRAPPTQSGGEQQHPAKIAPDHGEAQDGPIDHHTSTSSKFAEQLKSSAIFLPLSTSGHTYLTKTLLPLFKPAHVTSELSHWRRELAPPSPGPREQPDHLRSREVGEQHQCLPSQVAESQALPGLQKIMLVESRMRAQMQQDINNITGSVPLAQDETVEVWDWRVLEDVAGELALLELSQENRDSRSDVGKVGLLEHGAEGVVGLIGPMTTRIARPPTWWRRYCGSVVGSVQDVRNVWQPATKY